MMGIDSGISLLSWSIVVDELAKTIKEETAEAEKKAKEEAEKKRKEETQAKLKAEADAKTQLVYKTKIIICFWILICVVCVFVSLLCNNAIYKLVSEWLLFNSAIVQLYHDKNNGMMMMSALY